jgi:hypothetical protein
MFRTLTINDLPIAGGNTTVTIETGTAWQLWWQWFNKHVAEGRPHSVLKEQAVWKINGNIIEPDAWFLIF